MKKYNKANYIHKNRLKILIRYKPKTGKTIKYQRYLNQI